MSETNPAYLAAVELGHDPQPMKTLGMGPVRRWRCSRCGWRAISYDRQVYGTAVEGACPAGFPPRETT